MHATFGSQVVLGGNHESDNEADQPLLLRGKLDTGDGGCRRFVGRRR